MASTAPGKVAGELMMQLRSKSKLREKLVGAIAKLDEQLQNVLEQIEVLKNQRFEIDRQIITYETRLRLRAEVQDSVAAKESEVEELREQLAAAVRELEDYDGTAPIKAKDTPPATSDEEV